MNKLTRRELLQILGIGAVSTVVGVDRTLSQTIKSEKSLRKLLSFCSFKSMSEFFRCVENSKIGRTFLPLALLLTTGLLYTHFNFNFHRILSNPKITD